MRIERSFRRTMLVASALTGVLAPLGSALAQAGIAGSAESGSTVSQSQHSQTAGGAVSNVERIQVKARRILLREKNSPSAVTELGKNAIQQVGVQGSPSTLLRQAPSVNVYQQGIGNNEPVLSIRGIRGLEVANTLDDVPTQDLLYGGSGPFLSNLIGGKFDLSQISGVSIYPGVAYPDKNTFGTIGGTVAYDSLRPSDQPGIDVLGSVGSFHTYQEGITLNSGRIDGPFGTGYDAPSVLAQYTNLQTAGFIDYTPARYNNFEFALDKPYDGGLSKFQATVLYNTGSAYFNDEPTPLPYLNQNGRFSNPSYDEEFAKQSNQYLTIILKDSTYINDYVNVGAALFYEYTNSDTTTYGNPSIFYASPESPGSITVGGAPPFNQTIAGFGTQSGFGPGNAYYDPAVGSVYDGNAAFPPGSQYCPTSVNDAFAAAGTASPCGYNAFLSQVQTDTYGFQPRLTLTLPTYYGVANTIKLGALIAKETSPFLPSYASGMTNVPETPGNEVAAQYGGELDGGTQRTIYQVFAQDKIDMVNDTFHVTPGVTFELSDSSFTSSSVFGGTPTASEAANPYCQGQIAAYNAAGGANNPDNPISTCGFGAYQADLWDRDILPFVNVDYDLDKILPPLKGVSLYGSYGESALFAPVNDFSPNTAGLTPPTAAIVHLYEGGAKYNISTVSLSADYFYQKVDRDFGFFQYQSGPMQGLSSYNNLGSRQFQGQEFSAIWQVTPQWQLFGNFSHIRAVYLATDIGDVTVQEDQFGDVFRGTPITGVPHWLATFGVDYDHHSWFLHGDEFHARFEGQYTGRQDTSYDLTGFTNAGPLPTFPAYPTYGYYEATNGATTYDPNGGIEPYIVFNLDLNYSMPVKQLGVGYLKKLDFDLNILNLFNKQYYQYFYRQITPISVGNFTSGPYKGLPEGTYSGEEFADALAGEPFAATFTVTAHF